MYDVSEHSFQSKPKRMLVRSYNVYLEINAIIIISANGRPFVYVVETIGMDEGKHWWFLKTEN